MPRLDSFPQREATLIDPMERLAVPKLPDGAEWVYEIKLNGYRTIAVKSAGRLNLYSRRRNSFNRQYPLVYEALADLPDNTVVDGEVLVLDDSGRLCRLAQKYSSPLIYKKRQSFIELRVNVVCATFEFARSPQQLLARSRPQAALGSARARVEVYQWHDSQATFLR